tara:strand:- start:273 stop:521 length:249 start_codon:yes stop_codon:yes gene_type:complete
VSRAADTAHGIINVRDGDLVRYRICTWHVEPKEYTDWKIGVLYKYDKLIKIAEIISPSGDLVRIHARDVQLVQRVKNKHKKT